MTLPQPDPEDTARWWAVRPRREGLRGAGLGVQVAATPLPSEHAEALTQGAGSRRRWWINEHPTQSFGKVRSLYRLHHRPTPPSTARLKHPRGPSALQLSCRRGLDGPTDHLPVDAQQPWHSFCWSLYFRAVLLASPLSGPAKSRPPSSSTGSEGQTQLP